MGFLLFWVFIEDPFCWGMISIFVFNHIPCQIPPRYQLRVCLIIMSTNSWIHSIHFCNRANECELLHWPKFCCSNIFQSNRVMAAIVHIINPMFWTIVAWHWLDIVESFPFSINEAISFMVVHCSNKPMSAHYFCHILLTVNNSIDGLYICFCMPKRFILHVIFNFLARNMLRPILPSLFDNWLPKNSKVMECARIPAATQ